MINMVMKPPFSTVDLGDRRRFAQAYSAVPDENDLFNYNLIIIFAHPDLLQLCKRPCHYYIDGTWKSAPEKFMQDLIVMIYDAAYDSYIPVFHCLLQRKTAGCYLIALNLIDQITDFDMTPLSITCDFEKALILEIQTKFRRTEVIGCLFHFKQAIRRNLERIGNLETLYY
jgi:hypothetical protein